MIEASDPLTSLTLTNEITNTYKRLIFNGNQLVGAILYGDTNHSAPLLDKIEDGTKLEADLVVMAVGIKPNIQLAKESGLDIGRAILVNDQMKSSDPHIYAVGECAEHRGIVYGLVAPLYEQGKVLAAHICANSAQSANQVPGYEGSIVYTQSYNNYTTLALFPFYFA